ncbi:hypothetical protein CA13_67650 [Planctomycetes bacterium CA13]|uniref:Poly-gamma-glutamate system protein n=1 Tax=Novipirellula herctigrandis TaxID=2527986 RepID=A0A5C5YMW7_9BACT|nr:hypothetical protein CA13_67650 [Planctomycetes bacterium CA13]
MSTKPLTQNKHQRTRFQVMYWRPKQLSRGWLLFTMMFAVGGLILVEKCTRSMTPENVETMTSAARKAREAMSWIGQVRAQQGHRVIDKLDPQGSHLIGPSMSMVTSKLGAIESKQTSINPNFAAVVVRWLSEAGVKPGDQIAIGASGSWPGLNIAVYAAAETMKLRPTIVLSAASSQYGANSPEMMWLDMERHLAERDIIPFRAAAASFGGLYDHASGMTDDTKAMLADAIDRNAITRIPGQTLRDSIRERMVVYGDKPYAAYINVGGGSASIGGTAGQACLPAGLHQQISDSQAMPDCVAARMIERGIPVINMADAKGIASQYAMPIAPPELPQVGEASLFGKLTYRRSLAAIMMVAIGGVLSITVAPGRCLRFARRLRMKEQNETPSQVEWMV